METCPFPRWTLDSFVPAPVREAKHKFEVKLRHLMSAGESTATRFLILGGFLGAGKTTLAVNLAKYLKENHDKSVAIITNDQGDVLVDTEYTKNAGFDVQEVLGGCFCAKFDDFVKNARTLVDMGRPDIIIAEPIGTSTNILATVVAPLRTMFPDEFQVAPLFVVVDGTRVREMLEGGDGVELIPSHQAKEAEVVLLSKIDRLGMEGLEKVTRAIGEQVPDAEIIPYSSVTLANLERIAGIILSDRGSKKVPLGVENSLFASEKAMLGWYSCTSTIIPDEKVDIYNLVTSIMRKVATEFSPGSIAHVKVSLASPKVAVKMSLVTDSMQVDGLRGSRFLDEEASLVLNARVISPPKRLQDVMRSAVAEIREEMGFTMNVENESCYSPRPEAPSHFFGE
jgi:Ni2+-binding GTPase involved in maturation of urease and hydrogenase